MRILKSFYAGLLEKKNFLQGCQGSHAVLKALNYEIGFQDLERVLNFAKMYIKH